MKGSDPDLRSTGATSLCLWGAIKFAGMVTNSFDFEGPMFESAERILRAFGAVQTSYHSKLKCNSQLVDIATRIINWC